MMSKANLMAFDSRDALQEHFVVQGRTCHINFLVVVIVGLLLGGIL
jgi:hypothetical protein